MNWRHITGAAMMALPFAAMFAAAAHAIGILGALALFGGITLLLAYLAVAALFLVAADV